MVPDHLRLVTPERSAADWDLTISVIIPHLNQPQTLLRLLDALDRQSDAPPFEIIVVDNGSTLPLPEGLALRERVRLIYEAEPGPGHARSAGAAAAHGTVLAFIDADCRPAPGWLSAIAVAFSRPDAAPAIGGDVRIDVCDPDRLTAIEAYEAVWGYRQRLYVRRHHYAATCNFAVRADVFRRVGPFAGLSVAEDREWGRRASAMGVRHDYVPEARIYTPARLNYCELARKWDRHIAHDWAEVDGSAKSRLRWFARALALMASPLFEVARVAATDRLTGVRPRLLAFATMTRCRTYRAVQMLRLLRGVDPGQLLDRWRAGPDALTAPENPCAPPRISQ